MRRIFLGFWLLAGAAPAACSDSSEERVLARIGDRVITEQMYLDRIGSGGRATTARAKTAKGRRAILESMIRHEMLLAEAERRNIRADAHVRNTINPILSKRLLEKEFDPTVRIEDVPDEDVRTIYDDRYHEFHHPETWRFSVIQAASAKKAQGVLRHIQSTNNDHDVFGALATTADNIDAELRRVEGKYGYLPLEDLRRAIPEDLRPHFERLKDTYEEPEVVETERGHFVIMMTGHRPPLDRPYESVKAGLKQQAFRNYREKKLEEFVGGFRRQHHEVAVNYELLGLVKIRPPESRRRRRRSRRGRESQDAGTPTKLVERDGSSE